MGVAMRTRVYVVLICLFIVASMVAISACGGSESTTTTAAPTTTAAETPSTTAGGATTTVALSGEEAIIAETWAAFFDGSGAIEDKVGLLENGDQYKDELEANAASPLAPASTAQVTAVTITSPTEATVTYSILLSGQPALPDQTGQAVKQDGVWKVGAQSFLALLALQGGAVPTTTPTT